MPAFPSDQELNRRILEGNLERHHKDLTPAEKQKALVIATEAFRGQ